MSANDPKSPDQDKSKTDPVKDLLPIVEFGSEAEIDLGPLMHDGGSSGSIPLAGIPDPASSNSLTSWTEVIRRQRGVGEKSGRMDPPVVDAPSDRDLLAQFKNKKGAYDSDSDFEIPEAEMPAFVPPAFPDSDPELDLGAFTPLGPPASQSNSGVAFDVLFPSSDAGNVLPPGSAMDLPPVRFADEEVPFAVSAGDGESSARLADALPADGGEGRSSILDVLLNDGGASMASRPGSDILEFGQVQAPSSPTMHVGGWSGVKSTHESIEVPPSSFDRPKTPSWLADPDDDLGEIVPESRSGQDVVVDLYSEVGGPPSLTDSGSLAISEEVIEEARRKAEQMESSAVDLSSRPSRAGSGFDVDLDSDPVAAHPAHVGYNSDVDIDIDLDIPPSRANDTSSSMAFNDRRVEDNQAALAAEFEARRQPDLVELPRPSRFDDKSISAGGGSYMLRGTVFGLLLGAGGVLGAYFGGLLPNEKAATNGPDRSTEVAKLTKDLESARTEATAGKTAVDGLANLKKSLADAGVSADNLGSLATLAGDKAKAETRVKELTTAAAQQKEQLDTATKLASDAKAAEEKATKALGDAAKLAESATKSANESKLAEEKATKALADAMKATDVAKAEAIAAKKASDDALAGLNKALKDAGLDGSKPTDAVKALLDAKATAESKEKAAADKLTEATKKQDALAKDVETAKAAVADAIKAREASETTLGALTERLAKAKFVGAKPDNAAILKGIDDAIKAASTDATADLRADLAKARDAETKLKTDLAAAKDKEATTAKAAQAAKDEAVKLQETLRASKSELDLAVAKSDKLAKEIADATTKITTATKAADAAKLAEQKLAADVAKIKEQNDKFAKDATAALAKSEAALKAADSAKAEVAEVAGQLKTAQEQARDAVKLKTENDRLARELEAVKDLAAAIRTPGVTPETGPPIKPDAAKIADRYFGDALRALYAGRATDAESGFRKAVQFQPDDARYRYLLGVSLWTSGNAKDAETEFKKGHDLELVGRPSAKTISGVLERIQGPARVAVNAYRP